MDQTFRCPTSRHKIYKDQQVLCFECFQSKEQQHHEYQSIFDQKMLEKKKLYYNQINEFLIDAKNLESLRLNQRSVNERVKELKHLKAKYQLQLAHLKESLELQKKIVIQLKQTTEQKGKKILKNREKARLKQDSVKKVKQKILERRKTLLNGCYILYDSISSFPNLCFFSDEIQESKFDNFESDFSSLLQTVMIQDFNNANEFFREQYLHLALKKNLTLADDLSYSNEHKYNFIMALKNSLWMLYRLIQIFDVTPPYLMDITEINRTNLVTLRDAELWNRSLVFNDNHLIKLLLNFYYFAYSVGINIDNLIKSQKLFDFESLLRLLHQEKEYGNRNLILPLQLASIEEMKFTSKQNTQTEQQMDEDFIIIE